MLDIIPPLQVSRLYVFSRIFHTWRLEGIYMGPRYTIGAVLLWLDFSQMFAHLQGDLSGI